ncbi:MAG: hypothetical protein RDV48_02815 [Candidatus Eremiobacteraeota bacterium]|nr:hypothetical protein [Candidatus Eremiobacteraeota bacterium]
MTLDKIGASSPSYQAPQRSSPPPAGGEAAAAAPGDQFTTGAAEAPRLMANLSSLLGAKGLDKQTMDYRVKSYATGSDGTTFLSYGSNRNEEGKAKGYLSAVSKEGEVLWEAPVSEEGLSELTVGPDGTLFATTKTSMKAFNADGTLKFDHAFKGEVKEHFMDSAGNHYFLGQSPRELYRIAGDGSPLELPEALRGLTPQELKHPSTDELYMRDGSTISAFNLKEGRKTGEVTWQDTMEKKNNFSRYIDHFDVDDKGRIKVWIQNNTTIPSHHSFHDDLHFGLGGFRRPWGGMPHPPMDDEFYSSTTVTDMSIEQLGKEGKVQWTAANLGSDPVCGQLPDGSVFYTTNRDQLVDNPKYQDPPPPGTYEPRTIASGKVFVGRVGPGGKKDEEALMVEGKVKKILVNAEKGTFVVRHGNDGVSEYSSKGELIRSATIPGTGSYLFPMGLQGNDKVILEETEGKKAFSFDMGSGSLTPLTDRERDFSYKVISKEMGDVEVPAGGGAEGIEETDEWVTIGGIKLNKKDQ